LHAPTVLAEEHFGFERDDSAEPIEHRINIFVGPQVLELRSQAEGAAEQPFAVGLIERDVVFRVSRRVDDPEPERRRVEPFADGFGLGRRGQAPGRATVDLRMRLRPDNPCDAVRMGQGRDVKLPAEQMVIAGVVFMVVSGDALADGQLPARARHLPRLVRRTGIHEQAVDPVNAGPLQRPPEDGAGHPEEAHLAVVEGFDHGSPSQI
jgi:hypothetical protein